MQLGLQGCGPADRRFQQVAGYQRLHRQIGADVEIRISLLAFVQAQDQISAFIIRPLHRVDDNVRRVGGKGRKGLQASRFKPDGVVEGRRLLYNRRLCKALAPSRKPVAEAMLPLVTGHLRRGRSPQQRQLNAVLLYSDAVFAVVQNRTSMAVIAQGRVTVVAYLKPLLVIAAAAMRRTFHIAELNLMDRIFSPHVYREFHLQQTVKLPPLNRGVELRHRASCTQGDDLRNRRAANAPGPAN